VHATCDGHWFGSGLDATLTALLQAMEEAEVDRAVLTGIIGAVSTDEVLELTSRAGERLLPVGAFDPSVHETSQAACRAARRELAGRGLTGVKLHPRLGGYDLLDDRVLAVLDELAGWEEPLAVWICTLLHVPGLRPRRGPVEALCEVVGRWPQTTFVLAHGGGPDLLRLATAVRPAHNAMLDLSYTLTRLIKSSVAQDLASLLQTFERRLVFGSDFPEGHIASARAALTELADAEAAELVLGANLARTLAL
jgi:predicted TIM-barrel fold metal-dependent hydrolase